MSWRLVVVVIEGNVESRWPSVQGLAIHTVCSTVESEKDQVIVLVHGLGVSARYMMPTLECLAGQYRIFAPELPGFGQSDRTERPLTIPDLADILAEWLTAIGLHQAVFLGNSVGCQVIVDLAVRYPDAVSHAVLVSPTIDRGGRTMLRQLLRGLRDLVHEPWALWHRPFPR